MIFWSVKKIRRKTVDILFIKNFKKNNIQLKVWLNYEFEEIESLRKQ